MKQLVDSHSHFFHGTVCALSKICIFTSDQNVCSGTLNIVLDRYIPSIKLLCVQSYQKITTNKFVQYCTRKTRTMTRNKVETEQSTESSPLDGTPAPSKSFTHSVGGRAKVSEKVPETQPTKQSTQATKNPNACFILACTFCRKKKRELAPVNQFFLARQGKAYEDCQ